MRRDIVLAAAVLALALLLLPLAEAKGSYGSGGGRRGTCSPVDADGDGLVSEAERAEQCPSGSSFWPIAAVVGGVGVGGFLVWRKLRGG